MKWSEFKRQVDKMIELHKVKDPDIDYIDVGTIIYSDGLNITIDDEINKLTVHS